MTNIIHSTPLDELLNQVRDIIRQELTALNNGNEKRDLSQGYLSRKETADILKITLKTLHSWTMTGKVKGHRIGRRVLFKHNEIDQALKSIKV